MKNRCLVMIVSILLTGSVITGDGDDIKTKMFIGKSIETLGGRKIFNEIKNITFKTVSRDYRTIERTYFADHHMNFKKITGFGPYVERVTLIKNGAIYDNNFLGNTDLPDYDKAELTCFAKLISGMFTLIRFQDELSFEGYKKYGFKKFQIFKMRLYNHDVYFLLESTSMLLGRMIIEGTDQKGVLYKSMFDFRTPIRVAGFTIPGVWVNTNLAFFREAEDTETKINDFKSNIDIENDFWNKNDLNFGSAGYDGGVVYGNVIEPYVHHRLKIMMMLTNIRLSDMEKLGLNQHDDIIVAVDNVDYNGVYFPNKSINPPRHKYRPMVIFAGDFDAQYVGLFMWDKRFREKFENKTPPLLSVKIRKKPPQGE